MNQMSHIGVCVADVERSMHFYCDGLGFTAGIRMPLNGESARQLTDIDEPLDGFSQFVSLGDIAIELIQLATPAPSASPVPRPLNTLGFTHVSLRVRDVDEVAARLAEAGGSVMSSTRIAYRENGLDGELVFCLDPDGNKVELMAFPDEVRFY